VIMCGHQVVGSWVSGQKFIYTLGGRSVTVCFVLGKGSEGHFYTYCCGMASWGCSFLFHLVTALQCVKSLRKLVLNFFFFFF